MKAQRTDGLSLTFGVVFLVIVAWWAVAVTVDLTLPNVGWFVAAALILLGVLGLVGVLRSGRPAAQHPLASHSDEAAGNLTGHQDDLTSPADNLTGPGADLPRPDLTGPDPDLADPDLAPGARHRAPGPDPT